MLVCDSLPLDGLMMMSLSVASQAEEKLIKSDFPSFAVLTPSPPWLI